MDQQTVVVVSDLHINSAIAVCPPTVNLDDGGTYHASRGQHWLWECWLDFCKNVSNVTGKKTLVINGDLGELDTKRRSLQLITLNKATIMALALDVLSPIVECVDQIYIIRGTPAHEGKSAWLEEAIAKDLDGVVKPLPGAPSSMWHLRASASGVRFDIAHHHSGSATLAAGERAVKNIMHAYARLRQAVPDIVIRSHAHKWLDTEEAYPVRYVVTPGWQLITEYGYRIGAENSLADIGGMYVQCNTNQFNIQKLKYEPRESRRVWTRTM